MGGNGGKEEGKQESLFLPKMHQEKYSFKMQNLLLKLTMNRGKERKDGIMWMRLVKMKKAKTSCSCDMYWIQQYYINTLKDSIIQLSQEPCHIIRFYSLLLQIGNWDSQKFRNFQGFSYGGWSSKCSLEHVWKNYVDFNWLFKNWEQISCL